MAEGLPDRSRSDLQVFLSIKILTIRFDLFFGAPAKKNGKGMVDRSFFTARKEIIIPPALPCAQASAGLGSWETVSARPPLRWPALSGGRGRSVGLQLEAKHSPATLYFFWELVGILNRRVCVMTKPTKRHSKVTLRISPSPPLPLRWKSLWYYFKIHFAIWKAIWILSFGGGLAGPSGLLANSCLWPLAGLPHCLPKLQQLCCAVIKKQGNC